MSKGTDTGFKQLIVFVVIIGVGFVSIMALHDGFARINRRIDYTLSNEEARSTIGKYALNHLDVLEGEFYNIALRKNLNYAELVRQDMVDEIADIKDALTVIEQGGYIENTVDLNIPDIDDYTERIYYYPAEESAYVITVIDLNPKLDEILVELDNLVELIRRYEEATEAGDFKASKAIEDEIDSLIKVIPTHFTRMKENASRLIFESMLEIEVTKETVAKEKKFLVIFELVISLFLFGVILLLGYILGRQIIKTNEELSEMAYNAEKANIAKSLFVANMSHEIRTPLNAIIGFTEILEESELPTKEREYIDIITRSAKALLNTVNDILDLSKIESDNMKLESVSFSPSDLLEEVVELYNIKAKEKEVKIEYYADALIPKYIFGDPVRLKQIITNLLSNAIKFSDLYGVVNFNVNILRIEDEMVNLDFVIKDNGIGIPKGKQKEIFDVFTQAEDGTTRKYGGSGLGLAISNKLAKAMDSEIKLESEQNKGSIFSFNVDFKIDLSGELNNEDNQWDLVFGVCCPDAHNPRLRYRVINYLKAFGNIVDDFLPEFYNRLDIIFVFYNENMLTKLKHIREMYPDVPIAFVGDICRLSIAEKTYINEVVNEPIYGAKLLKIVSRYYKDINMKNNKKIDNNQYSGKVIVAEDNLTNQKLIEILMGKFGVKPEIVNNGKEALELYKIIDPDLIFLDIHMPIMDGLEATREIVKLQEVHSYKSIPIIALTADVVEANREKYLSHGMTGYLSKPIEISKLEGILSKYLINETEIKAIDQSEGTKTYHYDIDTVAEALSLDKETVKMIIEEFYIQLEQEMIKIEEAILANDREALTFTLHSLKGASANIRLFDGVALLASYEKLAKKGSFEAINLDELKEYYRRIKGKVDKQFA